MTGPPYPPPPAPGSNAIGLFEIGVSPIGTIPSFDVWKTIISQYANSPTLVALIEDIFECLDQTKNYDDFFDFIFNVDTAQGKGLDVWGRIVNVSRVLQIEGGDQPFGFGEASPGASPFGQGSFYSGEPVTSNYALSDSAYRLLILAKAAANISNGSIKSINRILMSLFPGRGNAYVVDGAPPIGAFGFQEAGNVSGFNQEPFYSGAAVPSMVMTYTFNFALTPVELAIVQQSGVLPKPVGVLAHVVQNA